MLGWMCAFTLVELLGETCAVRLLGLGLVVGEMSLGLVAGDLLRDSVGVAEEIRRLGQEGGGIAGEGCEGKRGNMLGKREGLGVCEGG